jgi:DUF4097 and DUF4098 domain-containing protein YvlB
MSDARKKILSMLAEGKITVEESEELLAAIDGKDKADSQKETESDVHRRAHFEYEHKAEYDNPFQQASKLGFDLRNLAQTIQHTVQHAVKKAEPRSRELKEKMKEFGNWMHDVVGTMASEIGNMKGEPIDGVQVDFCLGLPKGAENFKKVNIENIFGEIRINEGDEFKLHVIGRISKASMGEYQPSQWMSHSGISYKDETISIGFDSNQPVKAVIDMELTIPSGTIVSGKTVSSAIRIRGPFKIGELKTISGNVRIQGPDLKNSLIETVSGSVQIEGGDIELHIKSTSGDFLVRSANISHLKINSVSGDILLTEGEIADDTQVNLVTTSGDIIVEKMKGPWKDVTAFTRSGDVILDWKGDLTPLNNQGTKLSSGAQGAEFKAESVSGDIQFT